MKLKEKIFLFILIIGFKTFSYSMCSTHEFKKNNSIFNGRRNRFCATPYLLLVLTVIFVIFFQDIF